MNEANQQSSSFEPENWPKHVKDNDVCNHPQWLIRDEIERVPKKRGFFSPFIHQVVPKVGYIQQCVRCRIIRQIRIVA